MTMKKRISFCVVAAYLLLTTSVLAQGSLARLAPGSSPYGPSYSSFDQVGEGLYSFFHSGAHNHTIITDPMHPWAAEALREEIRKVTDKPIKFVIYTHHHWDHMLGGQIFKDDGQRLSAMKTALPTSPGTAIRNW